MGDLLKNLLPLSVDDTVRQWLAEDIPSFDYGGYVVGENPVEAVLYCKSPGVLAGRPFFDAVFKQVGCTVKWLIEEGTFIDTSQSGGRVAVAEVTGPANRLLQGERVALNIIARASGIATRARRMVQIADKAGWKGRVAGTRKTTPGFRLVEKYAMILGGADTHRMDLSTMIMLKDNHIWAHGSITAAVHRAKQVGGFSVKIEVECRSKEEAVEAIKAGADIVMLDNFANPQEAHLACIDLKSKWPHVLIELSGGLTEENIGNYMHECVDILSAGSLSQSILHVDFSLKVKQSK
ncbi:hypothetical protein MP638_003174 [Amoeboaphelidium occidentale]|nr:hypothetical protein MP638_003174 [Amoeboaphelidium occidentale]